MSENSNRPQDVGILALHFHLPCYAVRQEDLEKHHGAKAGKYTAGLGQKELAFGPAGAEDAASRALSAAGALLAKCGVPARRVARVDVGTETSPDRSKSIASVLCGWLARRARAEAEAEAKAVAEAEAGAAAAGAAEAGPCSSAPHVLPFVPVEAVDHTHACYGGAAALFAAAAWVESSAWDGASLALVVATDGAAYPPDSPARATGGGGAAAMLVGPRAPLALEAWPLGRASAAAHAFDFYKPQGRGGGSSRGRRGTGRAGEGRAADGGGEEDDSEDDCDDNENDPSCPRSSSHHPVVDGAATTNWFLAAAEAAARQWHEQQRWWRCRKAAALAAAAAAAAPSSDASLQQPPPACLLGPDTAAFVCHAPFARMVRKALGRLALVDAGARAAWAAERAVGGALPGPHADCRRSGSPHPQQQQQEPPLLEQAMHRCEDGGGGLTRPQREVLAEAVSFAARRSGAPGGQPPAAGAKELDDALAAALEGSGALGRLAADGMSGQTRVGNAYTASLFLGLAALLERRGGGGGGGGGEGGKNGEPPAASSSSSPPPPLLPGERVVLFAFGSGVVATLFTLRVRGERSGGGGGGGGDQGGREEEDAAGRWPPPPLRLPASVAEIGASQDLERRLSARPLLSPGAFDAAAAADEEAAGCAPYEPPSLRARSVVVAAAAALAADADADADADAAAAAAAAGGSVADLPEGAWYLARVDARYRRVYARRGPPGSNPEHDEALEGAVL